jgi:hypothetical protein
MKPALSPAHGALEAPGVSDDKGERKRRMTREILDYLSTHPSAADTVEGITRWWLGLSPCEPDTKAVEEALEDLVEMNIVRKTWKGDGQAIYARQRTAADNEDRS